jgi:hypothetical protein
MKTMLRIFLYSYPQLNFPYYAYIFSSTKLVIKAEQDLPGAEGWRGKGEGEGRGAGRRNDPNNVRTCE